MRISCAETQLPEEMSSRVLQVGSCMFPDCTDLPVQDYLCAPENCLTQLLVETTHVYQWYFNKELPWVHFKVLLDKYLLLPRTPLSWPCKEMCIVGISFSEQMAVPWKEGFIIYRFFFFFFFVMFCIDEGPKDCSSL